VRDEQGKLYIIPNGQIKTVTNSARATSTRWWDIKVPTSANLDRVMHDMAEAGRRLRVSRHEVLAETIVKGLVDLTPGDMVVRGGDEGAARHPPGDAAGIPPAAQGGLRRDASRRQPSRWRRNSRSPTLRVGTARMDALRHVRSLGERHDALGFDLTGR